MTNIALALEHDAAFEANVRRLVVMGGDFRDDCIAEHNLNCDMRAAQRVFGSGLNIAVGGLNLTLKVRLEADDVVRLERSGALGEILGREIRNWWRFSGEHWNSPHDATLGLWIARPDLFTASRARVHIDDAGMSRSTPDDSGRTLVLDTSRPAEIREEVLARALAAGRCP